MTRLPNSALQPTGLVGRRFAALTCSLWRPQLNAGTLGGPSWGPSLLLGDHSVSVSTSELAAFLERF